MNKQLLIKLSVFIFTAILFSASTNAQIVYTDVTPDQVISATTIPSMEDYNIDLNNDGISDYKISCSRSGGICPLAPSSRLYINFISDSALNSNAVVTGTSITYPLAMNFNDSISSGLSFSSFGYLRRNTSGGPCTGTFGVWSYSIDRYLGLKLIVGANTYYGWARMQIDVITGIPSCTIKDYAYNSIPNQPILAGETGTGPTGIFENSFAASINLFPNPFSTQTTLQTETHLLNASVIVYNSVGQIVKRIDNFSGQTIIFRRDNLPSGLYFIQITQDNKAISAAKLVVLDN